MSAMHHGDISLIRDEDLLKKMWQETEDFGKKKEIRSHMYKLREARLKDLYNTSEVKGVTITTNTKLPFNQSTHADSLADHSFASLKSKEIRDSESPTRDVSYRITGSMNNDGWNISKIDERSEDGKTHRVVQTAQTSGSEIIPKGKLDFEAKCDQAVTSFQDGDDKNFVRSQGLSSNTVMRQEAVGGDENCNFKTSSTKSSSSSKTVTEQKVSYDDSSDYIPHQHNSSNKDNYIQRSVKVYESDAPQELKNHPGYVEGNTKITRETKTLADGTVVTTTKYETRGANETRSTSSNQYSSSNNNFQQSKSNYSSSTSQKDKYSTHKKIVDSEQLPKEQPQSRSRYYVEKTHTIPDNSSDSYQNNLSERKTIVNHQTYKKDDQSKSDQFSDKKYATVITSDSRNDHSNLVQTDGFEKRTTRQEQYQENNNTTNQKTNISNRIEDVRNERTNNINKQHNTTVYQDVNSVPLGTPIEIEIDVSKMDINDNTKTLEDTSCRLYKKIISKSPDHIDHNAEQKRQPIKPTESEWKTETKATKNQYDTTYRTDYTNKRISVELSPTHDAFARSLRAVSPDRLSSRSSSRNLKNSNTSLRSSSSPEKTYVNHGQPSRSSPERQRCYSPTKKTPERLSSTETITYNSRPSVERTSPYTSQKTKHITETRVTSSHADKKKTKYSNDTNNTSTTFKSTRMSPTKSHSRSSTPSKSEHHRTTVDITTDLDDNISTISNTTISKSERVRPSTLKYEVTETVGVTKHTQFSPSSHIPNKEKSTKHYDGKDKPIDRPLKRTDTYEERCRQILGITNETTERRRSSLEKLKRRSSSHSTTTEISSKDTSVQQEIIPSSRISPARHIPQTKEKHVTPKKQQSPLQEFPAQIRRSPEKSNRQPSPTKNSNEKSPESYYNRESPLHSKSSPKQRPEPNERRSPSSEVNKNVIRKSADKDVRRDIQRSPSDSKKLTENYGDDNHQPETYDQRKNKSVPEKTQYIDITVSVNKESTRRDCDEEPNCSEQPVISEISRLNTPQQIPRHEVTEVHNLTSEEIKNDEFISGKTLSTDSNDKYVIENSVHTSQTTTFNKKSPKDEQPSVTDDVNIIFIKEETENRLDNMTNLSKNSSRKVHETQVTTNYNQSAEKNIMPISTTSKTSPIRKTSPLNKQSKESTRNEDMNTTFIEQEVINRKLSEDQIDISKRKDSKTHKYIVEDNNTIRRKQSDVKYDEKTEIFTPTSKSTTPKTSSSRETSPLKEYPSQVRKNADIDDVNKKFINKEIVNRQVTPEVPKVQKPFKPKTSPTDKRPNTFQNVISKENEDGSFDSPRTETPERIAPDEIVITKTNQYAVPEDIHPSTKVDQKHTINNLNQYSDIISITDSTEQIIDENKVIPNRKTTKLEDNFKPGTPHNVVSKNKSSPQHNIPKDRKSSPSQQNNLKEINKENSSINSEKTPQHKQVSTSRKPSYPAESEIYTSQFSEDISQDASILVDDIIYTNGDICEKNNIIENTVNVNVYTENVLRNNSHDLQIDSQDEVEIAITSQRVSTKKNRTDNSQKRKDFYNKEQDVPRNKEAKRNTVQSKEKSLNRTSEDKTSLVKKTVSNKDIPKPKDKPIQKITNYGSKKPASAQNIRGEISKQTQDKNLKIDAKKTQQPDGKLNGHREVKEVHKKEYLRETYEGRTPVEEPLVIKKSVSLLYSDEEDDKKSTQMLIESEIIDQKPIIERKKDKPERPSKTTSSKFIVNEKKESISRSKQPISKSSPKSTPVVDKKTLSGRNYSKPKMSGETEYTDKYKKNLVQSKHENNKRQNTITDIENFDDLRTDTSPHVRVHRIDARTNKTKTFTLEIKNNDGSIKIPKKITPLKKPSDDSPKSKTFSGNKVITEKTLQSTKPKSVEPVQHLVKETKPSTKLKHIVSTTIVLNPKTTTSKVVSTVSSKKKKDSTKPVSTSSPKKEVIECEESDDESIPDSLDETIQNSVNNIEINENQTENKINSRSNRSSPERKSPTRNYSQPDFREEKPKVTKPKLEKRCISTKSIIINNADRGVTVDLQRSISSREPTPDRVCPLPVTSDDEGNSPRFPDKVVEPDDVTSKRSSHRLFETVIQENDDGKDSQRIVEITEDFKQKVTEVDKVDRDDESLLTVNKKINKFLTTADKLTEKPIMDISQPAPKVERQKFEITEDLREDHCLLSVSDKVNKFINEAEYLTSHNSSQPRKSVNIDNRSDITKKVTLTPESRVNQESTSKPSYKKYAPKNNAPLRNDANQLLDQNVSTIHQDVFITTECDQIEKEEDSFRSAKHPRKEPEGFTTSDTNEKRISNFKPYSRGSKSPDKCITDTFLAERVQSTETIRKTEKDIEHFTENEQFVGTPQNKTKPAESSKTFTPKNRRPSQEEKIILSTVGRLRSNESIKKAKALFENKSSSKEFKKDTDVSNNRSVVDERNGSIKEISRRPIDRSSLTPKRLDFPTSDDRSVEQSTNRNFGVKHLISNQHKVDESKLTKSIVNTDEDRDKSEHTTLRQQQSPQREIIKIKTTTRGREQDRPGSKERDIPAYMKPLERNIRPHSPVNKSLNETETLCTQEGEKSIPGYMKPLDRTISHRSPQRDDQHPYITHEKPTYEESREEMPGYMKPSRTVMNKEHHHSSRTDSKENILLNESSQAHESISTIHHKKNNSKTSAITETHRRHGSRGTDTTDELPGYMKPLMKHNPKVEDSPVSKTHDSDIPKGSIHSEDIPGYMKPIHSHSHKHEHTDFTETEEVSDRIIHSTNKPRASIHSDDIPGYMQPIHSHKHEHTDFTETEELSDRIIHSTNKPRASIHSDDIPGYMQPIHSHSHKHEHTDFTETEELSDRIIHSTNKPRASIHSDDIPGYMQPIHSHSHKHEHTDFTETEALSDRIIHSTNKPRASIHSDDIPGYMQPIHSHSHKHEQTDFTETEELSDRIIHSTNKPRASIHSDDIPGYMQPIHSHSHKHEHTDFTETEELSDRIIHSTNKPRASIHSDDIPGYMQPIHSHSHKHEHTDFTETEELSDRIIHDTNKPRHSIHSDDIPGYMKPILSHSHLHEQTDSTHRDEISDSKTHNERTLRGHSPHKDISPSHNMKGFMAPSDVDEVPGYMKPLDRANRPHSPKRDTPSGYMKPLDRTDRPRSPKRDTPSGYMKPLDRADRPCSPKRDTPSGYMKPLDRADRPCSPKRDTNSGYMKPNEDVDEVPGYMKPIDRADRPRSPKRDTPSGYMKPLDRADRPRSPKRDAPSGYMKPLDRAERPCSPKRDSNSVYMKPLDKANSPYSPRKDSQSGKKPSEPHVTSTKFGVTLKKTDSMRGITNTTITPKKHPILSKKNITEEEIEEIFELEVLEELLLIVTGYELRRQIRTQIRTVKKLIAEDKLEVTIRNIRNKNNEVNQSKETTITEVKYKENNDKSTKKTSQLRTTIDNKHVDQRDIKEIKKNAESFENTSSHTIKESTSSLARSETTVSRSSKSPERRSPERKSPARLHAEEPTIKKSFENNRQSTQKSNIVKLPEEHRTKTTNIFKSNLKKTENITKGPVNNIQPEWTSQRNLKKVTTNDNVKKVVTATNKSTKKESIRSSSPSKEVKSTDVITSSYGVGPTDENGTPLFGLKALRAQNKSINTKVQGTVVSSQYYSETGKEPIGQISVTKYSSDPKDLGSNENLTYQDEGILSITTTQKFGFDDAPSLKQLTNTEGDIRDSQTNRKASTSKSSTVVRRNSVKALTQKFVENSVETSKSEQQSSYPKAGLILRSSSFKNESTLDSSDRYSEVTAEERTQKSMSVMSSNSRVVSGGTFLRNKSKVTGIQDVVTRMKAEDVEIGDTSEDIEARGLLNKYLGSQAILSGIEGQVSKTTTSTARTASSSTAVKNTTKVTTVIMENGKEVKKTRIFEHPISNEVLETVWDEQTLRYLLEQSTDYEERKSIRARLREIMAEQEACTELVKQASQDQSGQSVDEFTETNKEVVTEGPVTTTKVTTSRVITQQTTSKKPISPFAKFRQLDKQNSLNTPPSTPRTPGGSPIFKFTDAALSQSASTIKDRLLYWCRMKTKEYENIQLDNFSTSWADGLAFCALIHHFLPNSFDYHALTPKERRHNFTLAFKVADEKADIAPLLDVDDMVATRKPDWKCVFTYVQSIYRRFKDED